MIRGMDGLQDDDPSGTAPSITLVVFGDSLSLPRAEEAIRPEDTWPFLLVQELARSGRRASVYHRGSGGQTIEDVEAEWKRARAYVVPFAESFCLIQVGIVDCAPRVVPQALGRLLERMPARVRDRIVRWFHDHREGLNRFFTRLLGHPLQRTSLATFGRVYRRLLLDLGPRFKSVIAIGIAPADEAYERKSAGIKVAVSSYNTALREAATGGPSNVAVLDVEALFGSAPEAAGFVNPSDHHHISREGHALIARELARRVLSSPADARPANPC
jgi:hypothetical protein